MSAKNRTGCMIVALLLSGAAPAFTQNAPSTPEHVPLQKTIGQNGPDIVPSLIVMNARGASLQGGKLILTGVSPNSIFGAKRKCLSCRGTARREVRTFSSGPSSASLKPASTSAGSELA